MLRSKIFPENRSEAKVLVIGHDPRLQNSNTTAEYCFFADYFFNKVPSVPKEIRKYKFAESLYSYISWLTSYKYNADQYVFTNLCNEGLNRSAKNKIILIPERCAIEGLEEIENILKESKIEIILAMSLQVNYWLQKLGFYSSEAEFVRLASPMRSYADKGNYKETGKICLI